MNTYLTNQEYRNDDYYKKATGLFLQVNSKDPNITVNFISGNSTKNLDTFFDTTFINFFRNPNKKEKDFPYLVEGFYGNYKGDGYNIRFNPYYMK